jgi:hypothetical protein
VRGASRPGSARRPDRAPAAVPRETLPPRRQLRPARRQDACPFMASQTPCCGHSAASDQLTKSDKEAKAREVTRSKGVVSFSTRAWMPRRLARRRLTATCWMKAAFLGHRIDTAHCHLRATDGNHHTRQTGTRADIEHPHCSWPAPVHGAAAAPPPPGCPADGGSPCPPGSRTAVRL